MNDDARRATYRDLCRCELDDAAIADVRLALSQGQPLGSEKFKEAICAATGVRQTQARRGRSSSQAEILAVEN